MKYTFNFLSITFFFIFLQVFNSNAQIVNPSAIAQVRVLLSNRGLSEEEVSQRLKSRGIDIETMSQEDLVKNRSIIEQIIAEMEAEKKSFRSDTSLLEMSNLNESSYLLRKNSSEIKSKSDSLDLLKKYDASQIYGHKIFKEKSLEIYRISKDPSPPDNYVLGPGDKVNILIFGRSQADLTFEINNAGFIQPNRMPKIFLSGLTMKQAKDLVTDRFKTYYLFDPGQIILTLNTSRTITVNVFGEVEKVGSFTTSALNTALGALAVAGGPTEIGSVRNIQIIRGSVTKTLDIYKFMKDPSIQFDFYLQNNDIIYVPASTKLVSFEGAVNRPMRFELKSNEDLNELLEFAGGLRMDAYRDLVQIKRIESNQVKLKDYDLKKVLDQSERLDLSNGDIITVKSVNSPLRSFVRVTGAVEYSGDYDWATTNTIKNLIEKSRLKSEARYDLAFVLRKNDDQTRVSFSFSIDSVLKGLVKNFELQKQDEVIVYDQSMLTPNEYTVAILGEVVNPLEKRFTSKESVSINSAISFAGGLRPNTSDKAYIFRNDPLKYGSTLYVPINLSTAGGQILKPWDKLVIYSKESYFDDPTVSILGEVKNAYTLKYSPDFKIKDLVSIAGGVNSTTDRYNIEVFRVEFGLGGTPTKSLIKVELDNQFNPRNSSYTIAPFDQIVFRKISLYSTQKTVFLSGEVNKEGPFVMHKNKYHFSDLIKDSGGITENGDLTNTTLIRYRDSLGLIAFDAKKALANAGENQNDPVLEEGDYINIPRYINTISIETLGTNYLLSETQNSLLLTYKKPATARWYVNNFAGGFSQKADKDRLLVIKPNGIQKGTRKFIFRSYPLVQRGDRIVTYLKQDVKIDKSQGKGVDWDKMISRFMALFSTLALVQAYVK